MGSHSPPGGMKNVDVAVCTIEKGNSLINRMLEDNKLDQLGMFTLKLFDWGLLSVHTMLCT